jgi:alpha-L-fucosidase
MLTETPATLNHTWGFKYYDDDWKSADEVLRLKHHLNSLGINYLLNVGPDHLGRIPAPCIEIFREVGKRESEN